MRLSHLEGTFLWPATAVVLLLVAYLLVGGWVSRRRFGRLIRVLESQPHALDGFYRRTIVLTWFSGLSVPLVMLLEPEVTPADLGLGRYAGEGIDLVVGAILLLGIVYGGVRLRQSVRSGRTTPPRRRFTAMLPRTAAQRRLAVLVALTAGVVEEVLFRGLLITAGVGILGVPVAVAALLSLLLFIWGHQYQGRAGMFGAGLLGAVFTGFYLISGSLLVPIVLHATQDLVALLLTPAAPPPTTADARSGKVDAQRYHWDT